jgi:hypothetical protein
LYVDYDGGAEELYDLKKDPFQIDNLLGGKNPQPTVDVDALRQRVQRLAECEAEGCVKAENEK